MMGCHLSTDRPLQALLNHEDRTVLLLLSSYELHKYTLLYRLLTKNIIFTIIMYKHTNTYQDKLKVYTK